MKQPHAPRRTAQIVLGAIAAITLSATGAALFLGAPGAPSTAPVPTAATGD